MYLVHHAEGWMTLDSNCEIFQTSMWFNSAFTDINAAESGVMLEAVPATESGYYAAGHATGDELSPIGADGGTMRMRFYNHITKTHPPIMHFQGPGHWGLGWTHLQSLHALTFQKACV